MAEWIVFSVMVMFSVYDLLWKKVNVAATVAFGAVALAYRICAGTGVTEVALGLLPGIGVLLLALVTKESIGIGDGMVVCVVGLFTGIKPVIAVFGMALLLCAVLAMVLLACRRAGKKTELPFLPCLCGGYLLYLLW